MTTTPPAFEDARNLRQKVRAAGLDPDHWYAVEYDQAIRPGQVVATRFWGQPIAVYRGTDGRLRALEDRCAHRQLQLSLGEVTGCVLTCAYHGWSYDEDGALAGIPHDRCGRPMPSLRIRAYPVQSRYGLVWLFPGDPASAPLRPLPEVPELEGRDPWAYVPHSFTWRAHHSMVIDNLCDLTHAHLHRSFPSFQPGRLLSSQAEPDRVVMRYEAKVGPLVGARSVRPSELEICYDYPYHRARFEWSGIGGRITYWTFLLPLDADDHPRLFRVLLRHPPGPVAPGASRTPGPDRAPAPGQHGRPAPAPAGRLRARGRAGRVPGPSGRARDRAEPRGAAFSTA